MTDEQAEARFSITRTILRDQHKDPANPRKAIVLAMGQSERAPLTRAYHMQWFVMFKDNVTFNYVKQLINDNTAHIEPMRGTIEQNKAYVSKKDSAVPDTQWVIGKEPKQGTGAKWTKIKEKADAGVTDLDIWNDSELGPAMAHWYKPLAHYRDLKDQVVQTERPRAILYIYGDTGMGKSTYCRDVTRGEHMVVLTATKDQKVWHDPRTQGAEVIMIDEFMGDAIPAADMLRMLDPHPLRVEIKGGFVTFNPKKIIINSMHPPDVAYPNVKVDQDAFMRRLKDYGKIIHLTTPYRSPYHTALPNVNLVFPEPADLQADIATKLLREAREEAEAIDLLAETEDDEALPPLHPDVLGSPSGYRAPPSTASDDDVGENLDDNADNDAEEIEDINNEQYEDDGFVERDPFDDDEDFDDKVTPKSGYNKPKNTFRFNKNKFNNSTMQRSTTSRSLLADDDGYQEWSPSKSKVTNTDICPCNDLWCDCLTPCCDTREYRAMLLHHLIGNT